MEPKSPVKSKTIWANAALVVVGVLTYLQGHEVIVEHPTAVSILAVAVGLGNVVLRFLTNQPVK